MESEKILETIHMISDENLDVRTITMGISLLDCIDSDSDKACQKIYDKITTKAKDLVKVGSADYCHHELLRCRKGIRNSDHQQARHGNADFFDCRCFARSGLRQICLDA